MSIMTTDNALIATAMQRLGFIAVARVVVEGDDHPRVAQTVFAGFDGAEVVRTGVGHFVLLFASLRLDDTYLGFVEAGTPVYQGSFVVDKDDPSRVAITIYRTPKIGDTEFVYVDRSFDLQILKHAA